MARRTNKVPSETELEILSVLWAIGPCTVRDVADDLAKRREVKLNAVSTMVGLMIDKKLIEVVDSRKPQKIRAAQERNTVLRRVLGHMTAVAFGGKAPDFLNRLIGISTSRDHAKARQLVDLLKSEAEKPRDDADH
ncbi:MAG: BlaI/MecI/CopY family transcriptional regulator [Tepidisphaeraceae bacterium]